MATRQTELSRPLNYPSPEEIKIELARLAILRQAQLSEVELNLYAEELAQFWMPDLKVGLRSFLRPRREGETAFPGAGELVEACRYARGQRLEREAQERDRAALLEEEQRRKEHPEEYFDVREAIQQAVKAKAMP